MKSFKDFLNISNMAINNVGEIKDFPHEAARQLKMFSRSEHPDFEDDSSVPEAIPHDFYEKHALTKEWTPKSVLKNPEEAARHLDLYHYHFPHIADHYGMSPMTPEESERITGHPSPH